MKALSWVLFLVGTLLAAGAGARLPPLWSVFAIGIVLSVTGAVMLRRQIAASAASGGEGGGIRDLSTLRVALAELTVAVRALAEHEDAESLKSALESIHAERLMPIIEARLMMVGAHGVEAYAEVYTPLASGERCLNRAWSALVDEHLDEARSQVAPAASHIDRALAAWPGA